MCDIAWLDAPAFSSNILCVVNKSINSVPKFQNSNAILRIWPVRAFVRLETPDAKSIESCFGKSSKIKNLLAASAQSRWNFGILELY